MEDTFHRPDAFLQTIIVYQISSRLRSAFPHFLRFPVQIYYSPSRLHSQPNRPLFELPLPTVPKDTPV